jgi:hypothetical protein
MAELRTYLYEPYTARLETGRDVLVQLFRNPESGEVIHAQLLFRQPDGGWGAPYPLERKP